MGCSEEKDELQEVVTSQVAPAQSTRAMLFSSTDGLSRRCKAALPWELEEVPKGE